MVASAITTTNLEPVGISLESTARVQEFDGSTVTAPQLVKSLNRNGGVLIRNFVDRDSVAAIEQDVRPFINADVAWEGQFFPTATRRVLGLAQKSPVFTHKVIMHNLWQEVVDTILTTTTTFWTGQTPHPSVSRPQLSATAVFSIGPGAKAQELHRDDASHHNIKPATTYEGYTMGRESGIGLFVAGKKTTRKNGATRFVPGTHLDATKTPPPDEKADPEAAVYAEMEPGDAFMMLSSCYHGGSRNATDDEERLVFACFCVRGFLRQEENQYLVVSRDQLSKYPEETQRHIGYRVSEPFLGWVDLSDPLSVARSSQASRKDLFTGGVPKPSTTGTAHT